MKKSIEYFFNKHISKQVMRIPEEGCWIWIGCRDIQGYGKFRFKGKSQYKAHRASYEIYKGPIPEGLFVLHSCDNPSCVNPDHLFLGTAKDNSEDCIKKKRNYIGKGKRRLTDENRTLLASKILVDYPDLIEQTCIDGKGETGAEFTRRCTNLALERFWDKKDKPEYNIIRKKSHILEKVNG